MKSRPSMWHFGPIATAAALAAFAALTFTACGDDSSSGTEDIGNSDRQSGNSPTDITNVYFKIDPEQKQMSIHTNGICRIKDGTPYWEDGYDANAAMYHFRLQNDTLVMYHPEREFSEEYYVRLSGTPGNLDGQWQYAAYLNGLNKITPEGGNNILNGEIIQISGTDAELITSLRDYADFTETEGMYFGMESIFRYQDNDSTRFEKGIYSGDEFFFYEVDSFNLDRYHNDYEVLDRTRNSITILRKGQEFTLEVSDIYYDLFTHSLTYKVSSNGKTCSNDFEYHFIQQDECKKQNIDILAIYDYDDLFDEENHARYIVHTGREAFEKCITGLVKIADPESSSSKNTTESSSSSSETKNELIPLSSAQTPSSSSAKLQISSSSAPRVIESSSSDNIPKKEILIDNFDGDNRISLQGIHWKAYTDQDSGGLSSISNSYEKDDYNIIFSGDIDTTNGTDGFAGITGIVWNRGDYKEDPFVGIKVSFAEMDPNGVDLSHCDGITYTYKGPIHNFYIKDGQNKDDDFYQKRMQDTTEWTTVSIRFDKISQRGWGEYFELDLTSIKELAWSTFGSKFYDDYQPISIPDHLYIDNVKCFVADDI